MGPQGRQGPVGPKGPAGESAFHIVGFAYGPKIATQATVIAAQLLNSTPPCPQTVNLPLTNAIVPCKAPFTFVPYASGVDGYFLIKCSGKYLLQYGLTGVPSVDLVEDMLALASISGSTLVANPDGPDAAAWIAIKVRRCGCYVEETIGAVPLVLSWTRNSEIITLPGSVDPGALPSKTLVTGFGQMALDLQAGDQVSLQIFLATTNATNQPFDLLYIDATNITYPPPPCSGTGVARGPTLTIEKMLQNKGCNPCPPPCEEECSYEEQSPCQGQCNECDDSWQRNDNDGSGWE